MELVKWLVHWLEKARAWLSNLQVRTNEWINWVIDMIQRVQQVLVGLQKLPA